ncbi:helix-turn-helix transcriptional regulator [Sphingobacterium sp.]|uniref:helix-turn-helix transcriptional regulator n=1 Tax=Sphingobacterium sp. TaxID=341027 RepID=UPI0031DAF973
MENRFCITQFLESRNVQIQVSKHRPDFVIFPLLARPWETLVLPEAYLARQTVNLIGFHLQVVEINASEEITVPYQIIAPTGSLLILLRGQLSIHNFQIQQLTAVEQPVLCLSYDPPGDYQLNVKPGLLSFLVVSFEKEWILDSQQVFPAFIALGAAWHIDSPHCMLLPAIPLTQAILEILEQIRLTNVQSLSDAAFVLGQFESCLLIYHRKLQEKKDHIQSNISALSKLLEDYLINHYLDHAACTLEVISQRLDKSIWTLKEVSRLHFGCSIAAQVNKMRMEQACQMLQDPGFTVGRIAVELGYADTAQFSKSFKKYTGMRPADYRRFFS